MPERFDDKAATWDDDPARAVRATAVADLVRATTQPGPRARVLDYGAGTGLLAQALSPHVGPLTVADTSAGMRRVLAEKVASGRLPTGTRVWDLDLSTEPAPAESFDLVVSLMALHHIPDVPAALRGCAELLAPGGHVAVSDLVREDGSFHSDPDFDGHHGFDTDALAGWLHDAGFQEVAVRHAYDVVKGGRTFELFLATAARG